MGKCIFLSKPNESFSESVKKLKLVYIVLFYYFQALSN